MSYDLTDLRQSTLDKILYFADSGKLTIPLWYDCCIALQNMDSYDPYIYEKARMKLYNKGDEFINSEIEDPSHVKLLSEALQWLQYFQSIPAPRISSHFDGGRLTENGRLWITCENYSFDIEEQDSVNNYNANYIDKNANWTIWDTPINPSKFEFKLVNCNTPTASPETSKINGAAGNQKVQDIREKLMFPKNRFYVTLNEYDRGKFGDNRPPRDETQWGTAEIQMRVWSDEYQTWSAWSNKVTCLQVPYEYHITGCLHNLTDQKQVCVGISLADNDFNNNLVNEKIPVNEFGMAWGYTNRFYSPAVNRDHVYCKTYPNTITRHFDLPCCPQSQMKKYIIDPSIDGRTKKPKLHKPYFGDKKPWFVASGLAPNGTNGVDNNPSNDGINTLQLTNANEMWCCDITLDVTCNKPATDDEFMWAQKQAIKRISTWYNGNQFRLPTQNDFNTVIKSADGKEFRFKLNTTSVNNAFQLTIGNSFVTVATKDIQNKGVFSVNAFIKSNTSPTNKRIFSNAVVHKLNIATSKNMSYLQMHTKIPGYHYIDISLKTINVTNNQEVNWVLKLASFSSFVLEDIATDLNKYLPNYMKDYFVVEAFDNTTGIKHKRHRFVDLGISRNKFEAFNLDKKINPPEADWKSYNIIGTTRVKIYSSYEPEIFYGSFHPRYLQHKDEGITDSHKITAGSHLACINFPQRNNILDMNYLKEAIRASVYGNSSSYAKVRNFVISKHKIETTLIESNTPSNWYVNYTGVDNDTLNVYKSPYCINMMTYQDKRNFLFLWTLERGYMANFGYRNSTNPVFANMHLSKYSVWSLSNYQHGNQKLEVKGGGIHRDYIGNDSYVAFDLNQNMLSCIYRGIEDYSGWLANGEHTWNIKFQGGQVIDISDNNKVVCKHVTGSNVTEYTFGGELFPRRFHTNLAVGTQSFTWQTQDFSQYIAFSGIDDLVPSYTDTRNNIFTVCDDLRRSDYGLTHCTRAIYRNPDKIDKDIKPYEYQPDFIYPIEL